ncbi:MAG: hypothetical protein QNJ55_16000 [Xenococcus sp. MO_188.B8]|nr:hypothetical protein [Xenococcus sp. MO_188.B8]
MKNIAEKNGTKIATTAIIWGFATGMIAICIPLVAISRSGIILPLAVILGASTSTVIVWRDANQKAVELANNLQQIEQRIRNLETICSSEDFDFNYQSKQLDNSIKT